MTECSSRYFDSDALSTGTVTIATSIMPTRIEAQQLAVNSWLQLGFKVVSLNLAGEVEHIQGQFAGVHFAVVSKPEQAENERPNVALSQIFTLLAATGSRVCGIVNSDITFCAGDDFPAFIAENAAAGMVFGSRIDAENGTFKSGREYCLGFDYFFFDKKLLPLFPANDFYFGLPYWDYWVPLVLFLQRVKVKRLISPVAFHVKHNSGWEHHLELFGGRFVASIQSLFRDHPEARLISDRLLNAVEAGDTGSSSETAHFILRYVVESLTYPHPATAEACVTINAAAFEEMKDRLSAYDERLAEQQRLLESVYTSNSWRFTGPLRELKSKIRHLANHIFRHGS